MSLPALVLALLPLLQDSELQAQREAARAPELPLLADEDVALWRERIVPSADELAFEEIPWIPSFADGLRAAERAGKPLLFWAMNGHPLGCT